ncbi:gamma-butyrobetaine dioxygenase-like [Clavelina lepadiformis]
MADYEIRDVQASSHKNIIQVYWEDGHVSRFHSCWLRFNCRCQICKKITVGQHNIDKSDPNFSDQLTIENAEFTKSDVKLTIVRDVIKDHVTYFDANWLREYCYCDQCLRKIITDRQMKFADPRKIPKVDCNELKSDEGTFRMIQKVFDVGFVILTGVSQKEGSVVEIGERLAPIVDQTYGKLFNVIDDPKASKENVASSTIGLPFHTDQCHYERGPGIQMLHAIQFDECVEGGESQLVDMFRVMEIFRKESPADFRVLTRVPIFFSTIDFKRKSPAYIKIRKPVIQLDYDDEVVAFNWNPGTENVVQVHEDDVEPFYRAYRKLSQILVRPELMFQYRLREGDMLFFNNRRMVHARAAYKSNGGTRRLQGTYIDIEELKSKYVVLGHKLGHNVIPPKIGNGCSI